MKAGLYFGSFNPIHIGHLAIANYMVEFTDLQQVWFVISPLNPLKSKSGMLEDYHRYEMVYRAIGNDMRFVASNIEFGMPKPSYTIDTLTYLKEKYPNHEFSLIMGADNLVTIEKWKNYEEILKNYRLLVYPRPGYEIKERKDCRIEKVEAPLMEISASFLRQAVKDKKDIRYYMPAGAWEYMDEMNFYKR